jgi:hypothetical protein
VALVTFAIHFALVAGTTMNVFLLCDGIEVSERISDILFLTFFLTFICPTVTVIALSFANMILIKNNPRLAKESTPQHMLLGVAASLLTAPAGLLFMNFAFPNIIRFTNFFGFLLAAAMVSGISLLIFFSEQLIAAELSRD